MKRLVIYSSFLCLSATLVWGFPGFPSPMFRPNPPFRAFADGYSLALQALGPETNEYYCVGAKISHEWCPDTYGGEWVFSFNKNNVEHKTVYAAMRWFADGHTRMNPQYPLTEVRYTCDIASLTNNVPYVGSSVLDVGVVDFTEHNNVKPKYFWPMYFSLGGARICTLSCKAEAQGADIDAVFQETNADNTVQVIGTTNIYVSSEHPCIVSSGDVSVLFTPKFVLDMPPMHNTY
ncbi:MAG: hypothetical protein ABSE16_09280 [Verrucomicrobiota bacterium]